MYALILAGGKGERLRPLTDTIPKPLAPLDGRPILWHQVEWLKQAGVTHVIFLVGYRWEMVREYFGDGSKFGIKPIYSVETRPLGRGGAIRMGLNHVPDSEHTVMVLNGDIITEQHPQPVLDHHAARRRANPRHLATIMVVPMISPYGLVDLASENPLPSPSTGEGQDGGDPHNPLPSPSTGEGQDGGDPHRVIGFREKVQLPHWINAGVYVFDRAMKPLLPQLGDHEVLTFPTLAQQGQISAFPSQSFWRSIDSFKDLSEAEEYLKSTPNSQSRLSGESRNPAP